MAEAIISSLLSFGLENLKSLLVGAFGNGGSLKMEVEKFESTLTTIYAVLQDAEQKQWKSEALKHWLTRLRDIAYDASDVLEDFTTEARRRRTERQGGFRGQVSHCFSIPNSLQFRFKVIKKLKDVRERLDVIAEERSKFHLTLGILTVEDEFTETRQTSSLVIKSEIFGRGDEKEKLINMLFNDLSDQVDVSICALCGMGGLGKTTLAQLVYNDERVIQHFDLRIWVCVSEDFEILRLTKAILESIEGRACNLKELDPLHQSIQEKLSRKRFLLILDDVWNEYPEKWDELKKVLLCGGKGSTIIITTRIEKVALIMATIPTHFVGLLAEEDSYSLFKQRAFGMEDMRASNSTFEVIGKEIVKRCGGVPLAIKALGSLMRLKSSEDEWLSVKQSEILELSNDENGVMSVLRLSYNHLKPHLKQCFAYCSMFPKDHILDKETLIQHWMGNDFIPFEGQINLYDMGCRIFNELAWRSFFQNVIKSNYGDTTCRMHDLMHDLAQSVTSDEFFVMEPDKNSMIPNRVRHLYGGVDSLEIVLQSKSIHKISSIHTFIQPFSLSTYNLSSFLNFIISQKYLRVLDLGGLALKSMPNSIGNLIHLKYISFYSYHVKTLPKSMKNFRKLQTLKLKCPNLRNLPRGLQHMRELRYFNMGEGDWLTCMPPNMRQLSRLHFLSAYIVGKDDRCRISELQQLNLGGTLRIRNLDNVRDVIDARSANLMGKKNLRHLRLYWNQKNKRDRTINVEEILDGLQPHPNLEELYISGYEGSKFPDWMMNLHIQNLISLSLEDCINCECLPPLGKLRFLKFLDLRGMHAIKCFDSNYNGDELTSFSALMSLHISEMPNLEEWLTLDGIEVFPKLNGLSISKCPKLGQLPLLPTLKRLYIEHSCGSLLRSVTSFSSLTSLEINGIDELTNLPHGLLQNHMALESLDLGGLENLKSLSIELGKPSTLKRLRLSDCSELELQSEELLNLVSLETLDIKGCHSLVWLPASGMQSLSLLEVGDCKALESLGKEGQHLTSLRQLGVYGCPALKSLSATMRHLNFLEIRDCKGLISLPDWMGSLTSLSLMGISHCPKLMSLPEGFQKIGSLNKLVIEGCPLLERRCKRETGEDWHKIAHVPEVFIFPTNTR